MLANYECDLHGHTNRSDGNDSPVEYIRHAVHRGVKILAITDHDIVPPEMIELGGGKRQEKIDAMLAPEDLELPEELLYFKRAEKCRQCLENQYMNLEEGFLEHFIEEIYPEIFEA